MAKLRPGLVVAQLGAHHRRGVAGVRRAEVMSQLVDEDLQPFGLADPLERFANEDIGIQGGAGATGVPFPRLPLKTAGEADGQPGGSRPHLLLEVDQRLVEREGLLVRDPRTHRHDLKANVAMMLEDLGGIRQPLANAFLPDLLHPRFEVVRQDLHGDRINRVRPGRRPWPELGQAEVCPLHGRQRQFNQLQRLLAGEEVEDVVRLEHVVSRLAVVIADLHRAGHRDRQQVAGCHLVTALLFARRANGEFDLGGRVIIQHQHAAPRRRGDHENADQRRKQGRNQASLHFIIVASGRREIKLPAVPRRLVTGPP